MNAIEAGSLLTRLIEEVNFDDAIEAGSLLNSRLNAIEAGSLSTGSLKRSTLNDDAGYFESAQLLHELLMMQVI